MPLFLAGYAKFSSKGYDNSSPRDFLGKLQGKAQRSNYAQLNSFEAFPAFAAAVITAHLAGVPSVRISALAVVFVVFRVLYSFCYIWDKSSLRSLMWFGGFFCVVSLFIQAILHS